jgi:hypothetical protein
MGSIAWVVVGLVAWMALSVPAALLVGALLETGARGPASRRGAGWVRYAAPCAARSVRVAWGQ